MSEKLIEFKPVSPGEIIHTIELSDSGELNACSRRSGEEFERDIKYLNVKVPEDRLALSYGHATINEKHLDGFDSPDWVRELRLSLE